MIETDKIGIFLTVNGKMMSKMRFYIILLINKLVRLEKEHNQNLNKLKSLHNSGSSYFYHVTKNVDSIQHL